MPSFSITYGSLGGIVVTLFFFYISAILFIFGAEVNSVLRRRHENRREAIGRLVPLPAPPAARLGCNAAPTAATLELPPMTDPTPLMQGKKGLIMGIANDRSLAWGIAKAVACPRCRGRGDLSRARRC